MSSPAYSRLPVTVDLPLLLQALAAIADDAWRSHFNTDYFSGDWSGVALISAVDALTELSPGRGEPVQRGPWLCDERWQKALQHLSLHIVSARLLRLGPGGRIHPHRDYDLDGPQADRRLHIPLLSPPNVDFWLDGQRMPMQAGECWFLDLARQHRVDNRDTSARVHLVLDCRPGVWLEQMISDGLHSTPEPGLADTPLQRFQRLVAEDASLSLALRTLHDPDVFISRALELGAERGLSFSYEELRAAMRDGRRQWNEQWSG
ncbi:MULTISPECIES: aspartyl/asparaginyl beta-hydroxylase domain-containing protein [unclassified Pseudomonas]|uniref:aspartyl/asparaginyl beta-hydroxylase domain-containing protein n=1 Tax=unclassified Pseudomonas TaxID=196821 RepID=UPI001F5756DC|nr:MULTISPECIES: aspartyl/asparaginyl beta-hydroxylase domain-containing protein [unclassified Pseudomonas]